MTEQPSGAQIKAQHEEMLKIVKGVADQMNLRKWAVECAIKCLPCSTDDLQQTAEFFYSFVTKQG